MFEDWTHVMSTNLKRLLLLSVLLFALLAAVVTLLVMRKQLAHDAEYLVAPAVAAAVSPTPTPFEVQPQDIVQSILLVGDGGDLNQRIAKALEHQLEVAPERTTLIFLGDNIYPNGLASPESADFSRDLRQLKRQIEVALHRPVKTIFVPGNHDWADPGRFHGEGLSRLKRQQAVVEEALGEGSFLPQHGCPGPRVVDLPPDFTLVIIDSEWWIATSTKPGPQNTECELAEEEAVLQRLRALLASKKDGRRIILAKHHPLHGVGSHSVGNGGQDFGGARYKAFREKLIEALKDNPAFLCTAGHEHSLQYLKQRPGCVHQITSGALSHPTSIVSSREASFAASELGFARIDTFADGKILARFIGLSHNTDSGEDLFRVWLE